MTDAETPKILQPADGVWVRQEIDNFTWVDMGDHVIAIDALEQPDSEGPVLKALRETVGDKPVRYLLNTHTHYDHVALNPVFEREYGAEIINQQTAPVGGDGRWFEGPRRRLLWRHMGGTHTPDDCVAWVPDAGALAVGDIFGWGLVPLTRRLTDETAQLLLDTYGELIDYDPAVMIPGHGPLGDRTTLERWTAYFNALRARCKELTAEGRSDEEILAELTPPDDMADWWRFAAWKHEDSVTKVLRAVRRGTLS